MKLYDALEQTLTYIGQTEEQADDFAYLMQYNIICDSKQTTLMQAIDQIGGCKFCEYNIIAVADGSSSLSNDMIVKSLSETVINYLTCYIAIYIFMEHVKKHYGNSCNYGFFINNKTFWPRIYIDEYTIDINPYLGQTEKLSSPFDLEITISATATRKESRTHEVCLLRDLNTNIIKELLKKAGGK